MAFRVAFCPISKELVSTIKIYKHRKTRMNTDFQYSFGFLGLVPVVGVEPITKEPKAAILLDFFGIMFYFVLHFSICSEILSLLFHDLFKIIISFSFNFFCFFFKGVLIDIFHYAISPPTSHFHNILVRNIQRMHHCRKAMA